MGSYFNQVSNIYVLSKPYSFLLFDSPENATKARDILHQSPCSLLNRKVLFVEYVNKNYTNFMKQLTMKSTTGVAGLVLLEEIIPKELEEQIIKELQSSSSQWTSVQDRFVVRRQRSNFHVFL